MQRIVILLAVSVAIFEARADAVIPLVLAAAAALLASRLLPGRDAAPLQPLRLLAFLPWFLLQSARGGADVAVRAFRGPAAVRPGFVAYRTRIRQPLVRVIFANTVSLMPGTFTAQLDGAELLVHTLDERADVHDRLARIEDRVCRAFGGEAA
jgi:multicomponent Na+:H+ antiporter subunit E